MMILHLKQTRKKNEAIMQIVEVEAYQITRLIRVEVERVN
jgi:hypothetical protein